MGHHYTWDKLAKNAYRLNPKSRGPKYPYVPRWEISRFTSGVNKDSNVIVPYKGTSTLLISLRAWGVTQSSMHSVTLMFHEVEILTENPMNPNYFQIQYKGQMYWIKKLDKYRNPLTSRCTCFTGDTEVLLADGTYKPIKDLVGQEGFDIVAYDEQTDRFEQVKAFNCELKGTNQQLVKVTLDDGQEIKCTPDHRFLLRDGNWVEAQNLQSGDSLRALYFNNNRGKLKRLLPDGGTQVISEHKGNEDYYVYVYLDPRYPGEYKYQSCEFPFKPIYVGKGRRNRHMVHWNQPIHNNPFHNTLKSLKLKGLEPIILKQDVNLTEHVAYKLEAQLTHEIGLACDNQGPLLNLKHGGEGGLSGVAKLYVTDRMLNDNPMKDKAISDKVKQANIDSGFFERRSQYMKESNPMMDADTVAKRMETYTSKYTSEELSEHGKHMASCRTDETWDKIRQTRKTSVRAIKAEKEGGERLAKLARERAEQGLLHTQTEEWKQQSSAQSKANWSNPEIREKMLNGLIEARRKKQEIREQHTIAMIESIIKEYGFFHKRLYNRTNETYSVNCIKSSMIDAAYKNVFGDSIDYKAIKDKQKAFLNNNYINHKVKSVEFISTDDVYCLTTEYFGNFVTRCKDGNQGVKSGIVVENCKDFFFTWAWYNHNAGCLYGPKPRPYRRKTTWAKVRNEYKIVGVCKHIYHAWKLLHDSGLTIN